MDHIHIEIIGGIRKIERDEVVKVEPYLMTGTQITLKEMKDGANVVLKTSTLYSQVSKWWFHP